MRKPLIATATILCLAGFLCSGVAVAQLPIPASTQFDITGFLQAATLDTACQGNSHCGGTLTINGHLVTVPKETIVVFPANQLTWQEMFFQAPVPWGIPGNPGVTGGNSGVVAPTSGMAAADCAQSLVAGLCLAPPLTTWEFHVTGNRVLPGTGNPAVTTDQYIAGLISVSQQGLNSGAGFINFINYALGEMRVGGLIGSNTTGARLRINDPSGRYSIATTSPDVRFTVDPDNPTIMAGTGYPMCLARTAPTVVGLSRTTTDLLCPEQNRLFDGAGIPLGSLTTANLTNNSIPGSPPLPLGTFPDSTKQAPFEVGDYITFAGTLVKDAPVAGGGFGPGDGPTVGPTPALGSTYISAHTITSNVAIFTFQGSNPAYVMTDTSLLGTGGLTIIGAGEAVVRTRFEGMTTDVALGGVGQRGIHLYGNDVSPAGVISDRDWGTIGVDPGPPTGAVKGRWRFRPPCAVFGTVPAKPDKQCVMNSDGTFLPVPREMRAVIEGGWVVPPVGVPSPTAANGIIYGQYHAPIAEYIFPENVPGAPIVENNFTAMPFLAQGGYTSTTGNGFPPGTGGTLGGVLNPFPSNILPTQTCTAPVANAGGPYTVASTGTITLAGNASGTTPMTSWAWTATAGTFADATLQNPVYTAPLVAVQTPVSLTLTAVNLCGTNTATSTVTVNAPLTPTVSIAVAPANTVASGFPVTLTATAVDPNVPPLKVSFTWTQTSGPALATNPPLPLTCINKANCQFTFIRTIPVGQLVPDVFIFSVKATNSAGKISAAATTTVTVTPPVDIVAITAGSVEYRTSKQRLTFTATDSINNPAINLFLNPYRCEGGVSALCVGGFYNPDPAAGGLGNIFTNAAGLYTITLVGAPEPACNLGGVYATPCAQTPITVRSSLGGVSIPTSVQKIRQ